jgi:hypothetical protein
MSADNQADVERLGAEAARHDRNATIIRGSMSATPSPDDYALAERAQREADRAADKRALKSHLLKNRVNQLLVYFGEHTGCTVSPDWKIDFQCHRFYFRKGQERGWRYILDVYQGELEEQEADEIIQHLNTANWQRVLETYSDKRVAYFKDKRFGDPNSFQEWPTKAKYHP